MKFYESIAWIHILMYTKGYVNRNIISVIFVCLKIGFLAVHVQNFKVTEYHEGV